MSWKHIWKVELQLHSILTSVLHGGKLWPSRPGRFTPGERAAGIHRGGSWLCHTAGQDFWENIIRVSLETAGIWNQVRTVSSLFTILTELSQFVNTESEDGILLKIKYFYSLETQQKHTNISTPLWLHVSLFSRSSSGQYIPVEGTIGAHYTLWDPIKFTGIA
jgi:hypothetical protein